MATARAKPDAWRSRIVGEGEEHPEQLLAHPLNYRIHPKAQQDALGEVLDRVGYVARVIVNRRTGFVVDGHLRVAMAISKGEQAVPVTYVDLDPEEERLVLASFDPLSAAAGVDAEKVSELLEGLDVGEGALGDLLAELDGKRHVSFNADPDSVPDPPKRPTTRPGDLYVLGEHRLVCGDSTDEATVARVLGGEVPLVMATDPPYGVDYDPTWREKEARKGNLWYAPSRTGNVPNDDRLEWGPAYALFPGSIAYVWHAGLHAGEVAEQLASAGFELRGQIMWAKPYAPISRGHYNWQHEPCWYAVRKGETADWCGPSTATTVWEETPPNEPYGAHADREDSITYHGTQKPVGLFERSFGNHGKKGSFVYDPFVGSGTAIVGAARTERRCAGIEIDPAYCDVIVERWQNLTGGKPRRERA